METTLKEFVTYAKRNRPGVDQFNEFYLSPTSVAHPSGRLTQGRIALDQARHLIAYRFGQIYRIPELAVQAFLDIHSTMRVRNPDTGP